MEINTKYGDFELVKTATGLMAENLNSGVQLFINGREIPSMYNSTDLRIMELQIEDEYEYQHDL